MNPHTQLRTRKLCLSLAAVLMLNVTVAVAKSELRVCAEPDNLPFSNQNQEGFENKIAVLLADDLKAKLSFTWEKQRQGFIRSTLGANRCDIVMGVPFGYERVLTTSPYYRSGYVFVTAKNRHITIKSFDDPVLRTLKIGLHAIGNDGSNSPPAHALAHRGIVNNIVGYSMWGDSSVTNPQGKVVDDVMKGEIDVAIVWGPFGGYFAKKYGDLLTVTPTPPDALMPKQNFAFDIAIGVRKGEVAFAKKLEKSLERKRDKIQKILAAYNIPLIEPLSGSAPFDSKAAGATLNNHN